MIDQDGSGMLTEVEVYYFLNFNYFSGSFIIDWNIQTNGNEILADWRGC